MIDYGSFQFACPSRCATAWFLEACRVVGFGEGTIDQARKLFDDKHTVMRVSTVRHPCSWLASHWAAEFRFLHDTPFAYTTFDGFVRDYLLRVPGSIGFLFNRYKADSVIRLENLPWAFVELAEMLGVPKSLREKVVGIEKWNVSSDLPTWDPGLRRLVIEAERELCERYDYF